MDLVKLVEQFDSDQRCRDYLQELRWPGGLQCPRCKSKSVSRIAERRQFDCNDCRYQFSVTSGTIFHDSHLPLWKWFWAIYLVVKLKNGISANQVKRTLDISYKTAWYLCHRIRAAMSDGKPELLERTVEVDEILVGGKKRGVGRGYSANTSVVAGGVQRRGNGRLHVVRNVDRKTLHDLIHKHTAPDTKPINTDELPSCQGIADKDTRHETVDHKAKQWANRKARTNVVESNWSLLKRSFVGSFHKVSLKHLAAYLDESQFRYNNRHNDWLFRDTLVRLITSDSLKFSELTGK